jgi:hypothetical protein
MIAAVHAWDRELAQHLVARRAQIFLMRTRVMPAIQREAIEEGLATLIDTGSRHMGASANGWVTNVVLGRFENRFIDPAGRRGKLVVVIVDDAASSFPDVDASQVWVASALGGRHAADRSRAREGTIQPSRLEESLNVARNAASERSSRPSAQHGRRLTLVSGRVRDQGPC